MYETFVSGILGQFLATTATSSILCLLLASTTKTTTTASTSVKSFAQKGTFMIRRRSDAPRQASHSQKQLHQEPSRKIKTGSSKLPTVTQTG